MSDGGAPEPDDDDDRRFTVSLAALAFVLVLVIFGYWLVNRLAAESQIEDCALAGHQNCVPIQKPSE